MRHAFHPLSLRLINAKKSAERHAALVQEILDFWIRCEGKPMATVAPIPARDGKLNVSTLAIQKLKTGEYRTFA